MFEARKCDCRMKVGPSCPECRGMGAALSARGRAAQTLFDHATTVEARDVRPGERLRINGEAVEITVAIQLADLCNIQLGWHEGDRVFSAAERLRMDMPARKVEGLMQAALRFQGRLPEEFGRLTPAAQRLAQIAALLQPKPTKPVQRSKSKDALEKTATARGLSLIKSRARR